ncbi:MAG: ATP-binding protein [Steroidobacteraceae bacterium]
MRFPLPQTLFGRLFAATVAVVGATLLVIILLVVHERRELAFTESGAGAAAASIVQTSTYLAKLPAATRAAEMQELRAQPILVERMPSRRPPPPRGDSAAAERTFARQVQRELGDGYRVAARSSRLPEGQAIVIRDVRGPYRMDPLPRRDGPGPMRGGPPSRMFDLAVTLPDGAEVVFRTPAPRGNPPLPRTLFIELGALTVVLGIVLYAMTRTITRPLAELAGAADALGRGAQVAPLQERGARELKGATRAFNAMQERLRRYLDSRTRVLAAMSHDLRTPLTRLRLRVESIEDETLRQRCAEDVDEMARMVQGALSIFRGLNDEEQASDIDINALLHELERQYGETGKLVRVEGHAHAPFNGKPLALKRSLSNLIDNAIQYGTQATLQVEDGAQLAIRVLDEGPGIPADALDQVFEPFFRLESSRNRSTGGTGLGFSIARDIAQAHDGSLTLHNRPEGGLAAVLTLPRRMSTRRSESAPA